jgi:hypothetical protein
MKATSFSFTHRNNCTVVQLGNLFEMVNSKAKDQGIVNLECKLDKYKLYEKNSVKREVAYEKTDVTIALDIMATTYQMLFRIIKY